MFGKFLADSNELRIDSIRVNRTIKPNNSRHEYPILILFITHKKDNKKAWIKGKGYDNKKIEDIKDKW